MTSSPSGTLSPMITTSTQVVYTLPLKVAGMVRRLEFKLTLKSLPGKAVEDGEKKNEKEWFILRGCVRLALKQPVTVVVCPTSGSVTFTSAMSTVKTIPGSGKRRITDFAS